MCAVRAVGGSETILVVEDEDGLRNKIRDILLSRGYSVLEAHSGEEALTLLQKRMSEIDLVLRTSSCPSAVVSVWPVFFRAGKKGRRFY